MAAAGRVMLYVVTVSADAIRGGETRLGGCSSAWAVSWVSRAWRSFASPSAGSEAILGCRDRWSAWPSASSVWLIASTEVDRPSAHAHHRLRGAEWVVCRGNGHVSADRASRAHDRAAGDRPRHGRPGLDLRVSRVARHPRSPVDRSAQRVGVRQHRVARAGGVRHAPDGLRGHGEGTAGHQHRPGEDTGRPAGSGSDRSPDRLLQPAILRRGRRAASWSGTKRHHLPLSLVFIDCDNLKRVNDTLGHSTGDDALRVDSRCDSRTRAPDRLCLSLGRRRVRGHIVVRRNRRHRQKQRRFNGRSWLTRRRTICRKAPVSALARCAVPADTADLLPLVREADERMYRNKRREP